MAETKAKRTLAQKLLELQKTVVKLSKNEKGYDYKFVSGSKLLSFIRPAMDELSLLLVPDTVSVDQQIVKTLEAIPASGNYKGRAEKYEVLVTLTKTFTWIDAETGESLKTTFISQGCNGWDKAIGSAETYAERYFILKFFHIATDEDDVDMVNAIRSNQNDKDQTAAGTQPAGTQRRTNRTVQKTTPTPAAPTPAAPTPAAPAPAQPQAAAEDLVKKAAETRAKWVRAIAEGVKTKSGKNPLDAFIESYHPSEQELAELDADVMQYRLEHNIRANSINA